MASKKKKKTKTRARRPAATKRGKAKAGAKQAKRASAGRPKAKRASPKPKPKATPKAKATPKRKRAQQRTVLAKASPPAMLDEVIEEPLQDVSTVLRIKDRVARSQRDVDEDELKQFPDPSLVIDVEISSGVQRDDEDSASDLPDLFAAEERRQKQRARDNPPATQKTRDDSLFGSLATDAAVDDADED